MIDFASNLYCVVSELTSRIIQGPKWNVSASGEFVYVDCRLKNELYVRTEGESHTVTFVNPGRITTMLLSFLFFSTTKNREAEKK